MITRRRTRRISPFLLAVLPAGEYEARVTRMGMIPRRLRVRVRPGRPDTVRIRTRFSVLHLT